MKTPTENVAIYWGAFNPPTLAHGQIVEEILKTREVSQVIISPSWEREDKDFGIQHEDRRKLINTFLQILQESWCNAEIDPHFFDGRNAWITTTRAEEEYFRKILWHSPYFIFWSDVASNMHWWSNNKDRYIEEKLRKIFINRPGYEYDFTWNGFDNYMLLDIPHVIETSSSVARELIRNKQSVKWILHPEIEKSISKNNISYN
jgi:nicotinic acid mononucleotide adenylyltransferase